MACRGICMCYPTPPLQLQLLCRKMNSRDKYKHCHSHCLTSLCQTAFATNSTLFSVPVQQQPSLWESVNCLINSTEALSTKQPAVPAERGENGGDCSLNIEFTAPSLGWQRIGSPTRGGVNCKTLFINLNSLSCFVDLHRSQCNISHSAESVLVASVLLI